jgi:predicted nucleic acid-binding protein
MAQRSHPKRKTPPARLILDSGAVFSLARGENRPRALLEAALELGVDIRIPVAVLAETLRGGTRDAPVHRVRNAVDVFPAGERIGRLAGALLGTTGGTNTVDALVAAEAVASEADVVTGDAEDLRRLLLKHPRIRVIAL